MVDAGYAGESELPVLGVVSAPTAVPIRPDGYVAWLGDGSRRGLPDALATWSGRPERHVPARRAQCLRDAAIRWRVRWCR